MNSLVAAYRRAIRTAKSDKQIDGKNCRIKWGTQGRDSSHMLIEELPSKPLKRKLRRTVINTYHFLHVQHLNGFIMANLVQDARLSSSMDYDQAVNAMRKAVSDAANAAEKADPSFDFRSLGGDSLIDESQVFYLEVEPADYEPMEIAGRDFTVSTEWGKFRSYAPGSDLQSHDPSYTYFESKSAGGARKFYKMAKANPDLLSSVSWNGLADWFNKHKVAFGTHFSSWR